MWNLATSSSNWLARILKEEHMSEQQKQAQLHEAFYAKSVDEVTQAWDTTLEGLTSSEAKARLAKFGPNELEEGKKKSMLQKFIEQFKDLMIAVL